MLPLLTAFRFTEDDYSHFMLKIYPNTPQEAILEYKNHFSGHKETIKDTSFLQLTLYPALKKLEEYLKDEVAFQAHLSELTLAQQEALEEILKTIRFKNEDSNFLLDLLSTLDHAKEAGFFQSLHSITEIKNATAWSF